MSDEKILLGVQTANIDASHIENNIFGSPIHVKINASGIMHIHDNDFAQRSQL